MIFIGIDPGLSGAIAGVSGNELDVTAMPIVSGKGRDQYDLGQLLNLFRHYTALDAFAVCEKLQPMPMTQGGTIANYNRGRALGIIEALLVACAIPYALVAPRTWQKLLHAGTSGDDTKQRSLMAAKRLFPGVDLRRTARSRKDDDNIAEALLLAEYARRMRQGVPVNT